LAGVWQRFVASAEAEERRGKLDIVVRFE